MADRSSKLDSLFAAALAIDSPAERVAFVGEACGEDAELRGQIEKLLKSHEEAGDLLDSLTSDLRAALIDAVEGNHRAHALEAGFAAAFTGEQAVVLGDGNHSVLKSLGKTVANFRPIELREAKAEGGDPIVRPLSSAMPPRDSDSRYHVQGEIARGGMGAILKGRDTDLGRELAIKVLLDEHKSKPEVVQRFIEEAQIGGQLQHPGIAPIYELGQFADQRPFFSMKLVKGETLSKLLSERKDPAEDRVRYIGIFEQICQTMAYAHSRGVIHRDLKPANIMVGSFGEVQVMDWGLAKVLPAGGVADEKKARNAHTEQSFIKTLRSGTGSDIPGTIGSLGSETQVGSVMGTPAYMPPEQALGEIDLLDERADVFGLGAILCQILTGKPPYVANDGTEIFRMASRGKLADCFARLDGCGADADLVTLTKHCLELEPADRPRDASVLAERISEYLESVESKLRATELAKVDAQARAEELGRRRKLLYAIAALLLIGLVGTTYAASHFRVLERTQRSLAERNQILARDYETERNEAVAARMAEAEQRRIAETSQQNEAHLRSLAEDREQTLRATLYAAEMNLAGQAAEAPSGIRRVLELTSRWAPAIDSRTAGEESSASPQASSEPVVAATDLRGWEWYYLWSLSHQARLSLQQGDLKVDWSPDGQHFASSGGQAIHIWNARSGTLQKQFGSSGRYTACLGYSPDGTKIAAGGLGDQVEIFDPATGALLTSLQVDFAETRGLCWSPDGRQLAVTGWNERNPVGEISLWDLETGKRIRSVAAALAVTEGSCDWSPDGTKLVINGRIYGAQSLELLSQPVVPIELAGSSQFSPQGDLFAFMTGKDIEIRSTPDSVIKGRLTGHVSQVLSIRWSPDGKLIASCSKDDTVRVWDVESKRELITLRGHSNDVDDVQWNPNGTQLLSADGETIQVWDYDGANRLFSPLEHPTGVQTLLWDAEGEVLAAGGLSGLQLFDSESGIVLASATAEHAGNSCQFSPTVAWDSNNGRIAVWHGETIVWLDDQSLEKQSAWQLPDDFGTIAVSPDGTKLAATFPQLESDITIYDTSTGKPLATVEVNSFQSASLCWSPDGRFLACGGHMHGIVVDGTTGAFVRDLNPQQPTKFLNSIAWSPSGDRIAVACENQMIVVFDADTGAIRQTLLGHTGGVECVAWNFDSTRLASCGLDKSVRIWNPDEGALLLTLTGHGDDVRSVAWSPDGVRLASASVDGDIRIWNAYAGYQNTGSPRILDALNRRLAENPDRLADLQLRSNVLEHLENKEASLRDRERIVEILQQRHAQSPDDPSPLEQLAELSMAAKDWPTAIDAYSQLIGLEPKDSAWRIRRAAVYMDTEQWELAAADWTQIVEAGSGQLRQAFDVFSRADRWNEAADFGFELLQQNPDDSSLWIPVAPIMAQSSDEADYRRFCEWIGDQPAVTCMLADRAIKASLLKPGYTDLAKLPTEVLARELDEGTAPEWLLPYAWSARALLAYRKGEPERGVEYATRSATFDPHDFIRALNLSILAMAHDDLGHSEAASDALQEASQLVVNLQTASGSRQHPDLLIAQILLREAEAKLQQ